MTIVVLDAGAEAEADEEVDGCVGLVVLPFVRLAPPGLPEAGVGLVCSESVRAGSDTCRIIFSLAMFFLFVCVCVCGYMCCTRTSMHTDHNL